MASSILRRCISPKATAYSHLNNAVGRCSMMKMSSLVSTSGNNNSTCKSSTSSPWLMLPPSFEHNKLNFNFYSLSQDKILNFTSNVKSFMGDDVSYTDIEFISSSHGWLTLFNPKNCDLFLFNPLSNRHIKLPTINFLPIPQKYLKSGSQCVIKLITSCSPEHEDCRVMMSFGPHERLAFCCPAAARPEWTTIGAIYLKDDENKKRYARGYEHFVYSRRQKLFYCITEREDDFEAWDLQDTEYYPKVTRIQCFVYEDDYPWPGHQSGNEMEKNVCCSWVYLVVAEESDDIFWVRRHVMSHLGPDGTFVDYDMDKTSAENLPYKTIGFDVHKFDQKKCELVHMDEGSLDGLSFFIGNNHSFAMRASEFPGLKPNSIYFTDVNTLIAPRWEFDRVFVGHDIGIFNYEDQTFSPCYYPCDRQSIQTITPVPMWFTPTN